MSLRLDAIIELRLHHHLVNTHHKEKAAPLNMGTMNELDGAVKISASKTVSQCFSPDGTPRSFPKLPKRSYLVACVGRFPDEHVIAIYTLEQMRQMQTERSSGAVKRIEWRVLEISEKLEADFLKKVDLVQQLSKL